MTRLALVAVLLVGLAGAARAAGPVARYDLDVHVDVEAQAVDGRARIVVPNRGTTPLRTVDLWRYPERFRQRSSALNDYNFYWVYPRKFNPGGMRTGPVMVDGVAAAVEVRDHPLAGKGTLLHVTLPRPIAPGGQATLDVGFAVHVPTRYGIFGCYRGRCILGGGFYPMLASSPDEEAPPEPADYRVTVHVPRVSDVLINGVLHPLAQGGAVTVELGRAKSASLVVGRPRYRTLVRDHHGVRVVLYTDWARGVRSPMDSVLPYQPLERADKVLTVAGEALDMLDELGMGVPRGETLRLVVGAERLELAVALPGCVLVSDQIFDIFPLQRFLKFHEFELARGIYQVLLSRRELVHEAPKDLGWAPQMGAAYLVDLYTIRSYHKREFARQILAWASFIPAIDRILYAPQIQYASAYFYTLDNPDPLRDSLAQFANRLPRGKLVYSKLRDLLGGHGVDRVLRAQLAGMPLRAAAERVRGASLDWFWKQWLGPYPPVDYRFVDVRSKRRGKRWVHTAVVEKVGKDAPVEPVEVQAEGKDGVKVLGRWDGVGRRHTYRFEMGAELKSIEIDPRGRLVEKLPGSNDDLKFDDRRPPRWKFIYNNFGGILNFQTFSLDLALDFSLSRILDLKNSMRFVAYHSESTQIGAAAGYTRSFGRKITPARLSSYGNATLTVARLQPSFGQALGAGTHPGTQMNLSTSLGYDDRLYPWEPRRALSLSVDGSVAVTVLDNATVLSQGTVGAGWESIVPLGDGQGLAMALSGGITFGDLRIASQMLSSGAPGGARGYEADELLGRANLIGRLEWRHVFIHDIDFNVLNSLYIHGLGGGLFAEGALTTACDSYAVDEKSLAYDVGYTLRAYGSWFGVSQTTFNVDIAVPLTRPDRSCFGPLAPSSSRLPVGIFVSFGPPW